MLHSIPLFLSITDLFFLLFSWSKLGRKAGWESLEGSQRKTCHRGQPRAGAVPHSLDIRQEIQSPRLFSWLSCLLGTNTASSGPHQKLDKTSPLRSSPLLPASLPACQPAAASTEPQAQEDFFFFFWGGRGGARGSGRRCGTFGEGKGPGRDCGSFEKVLTAL